MGVGRQLVRPRRAPLLGAAREQVAQQVERAQRRAAHERLDASREAVVG